jgi:hypothetical protein
MCQLLISPNDGMPKNNRAFGIKIGRVLELGLSSSSSSSCRFLYFYFGVGRLVNVRRVLISDFRNIEKLTVTVWDDRSSGGKDLARRSTGTPPWGAFGEDGEDRSHFPRVFGRFRSGPGAVTRPNFSLLFSGTGHVRNGRGAPLEMPSHKQKKRQ